MRLLRVHAYAVEPGRLTRETTVEGGTMRTSSDLSRALDDAAKPIDEDGIPIAFVLDPETRTNHVRDLCRAVALEGPAKALEGARDLAKRLSGAMDHRSEASLLVLAVYDADSDVRRLHMWTFPREEALRFRSGATPTIEFVRDIFSRRSRLRKGARFEGRDDRTGFLNGSAFDYQASYGVKPIADLWIVRFLNAQLEMTPSAGTRMIADCLRKAFDGSTSAGEREELYRAALGVRGSRKKRWSLQEFAKTFLTDELGKRFISLAPNEQSRGALFDIDHAEFEARIDTRVFTLRDGVIVSAPFGTVGQSVRPVRLEGKNETLLRVEGVVAGEHVRRKAKRRT
jgi:hypothetical protein